MKVWEHTLGSPTEKWKYTEVVNRCMNNSSYIKDLLYLLHIGGNTIQQFILSTAYTYIQLHSSLNQHIFWWYMSCLCVMQGKLYRQHGSLGHVQEMSSTIDLDNWCDSSINTPCSHCTGYHYHFVHKCSCIQLNIMQ